MYNYNLEIHDIKSKNHIPFFNLGYVAVINIIRALDDLIEKKKKESFLTAIEEFNLLTKDQPREYFIGGSVLCNYLLESQKTIVKEALKPQNFFPIL